MDPLADGGDEGYAMSVGREVGILEVVGPVRETLRLPLREVDHVDLRPRLDGGEFPLALEIEPRDDSRLLF